MECDICFEYKGRKCLKCNLKMCNNCLTKWEYKECPQCKKENTFIHKLDSIILNMAQDKWIVNIKRSEINDDYIETLELSYNWNTSTNDYIEKVYYSPFIRNCRGKIVGSPSGDPLLVKKVEYKTCFFW
tara:strand:- start:3311 stop:3697 length:387 start_codon:yes stop_codon:yes gene_type:complete